MRVTSSSSFLFFCLLRLCSKYHIPPRKPFIIVSKGIEFLKKCNLKCSCQTGAPVLHICGLAVLYGSRRCESSRLPLAILPLPGHLVDIAHVRIPRDLYYGHKKHPMLERNKLEIDETKAEGSREGREGMPVSVLIKLNQGLRGRHQTKDLPRPKGHPDSEGGQCHLLCPFPPA